MNEITHKAHNNLNVILIAIAFFAMGTYTGYRYQPAINMVNGISGKETTVATTADFAPFWKVWNTINEKYPDAKGVSDQDRVYGAISGLISSLNDPYSVFFKPEEAKMFEDEISGTFSGIGVEVGVKNKILTVIAPLKDTPGYKAGLKSGDKILKIDKSITSDLSIDKAIKLIRGERGT
ncbi:MAG: PDZ domain-containing protein, partial [Candidatus Paceibacterota bacterium]